MRYRASGSDEITESRDEGKRSRSSHLSQETERTERTEKKRRRREEREADRDKREGEVRTERKERRTQDRHDGVKRVEKKSRREPGAEDGGGRSRRSRSYSDDSDGGKHTEVVVVGRDATIRREDRRKEKEKEKEKEKGTGKEKRRRVVEHEKEQERREDAKLRAEEKRRSKGEKGTASMSQPLRKDRSEEVQVETHVTTLEHDNDNDNAENVDAAGKEAEGIEEKMEEGAQDEYGENKEEEYEEKEEVVGTAGGCNDDDGNNNKGEHKAAAVAFVLTPVDVNDKDTQRIVEVGEQISQSTRQSSRPVGAGSKSVGHSKKLRSLRRTEGKRTSELLEDDMYATPEDMPAFTATRKQNQSKRHAARLQRAAHRPVEDAHKLKGNKEFVEEFKAWHVNMSTRGSSAPETNCGYLFRRKDGRSLLDHLVGLHGTEFRLSQLLSFDDQSGGYKLPPKAEEWIYSAYEGRDPMDATQQ